MPKKKAKVEINWNDRSILAAINAAQDLFVAIAREHGPGGRGVEIARTIFAKTDFCWKLSQTEENMGENWNILWRYDSMKPKPSVNKLARELAAEGLGTFDTVKGRINKLRRQREKAMADGTWPADAPPWPNGPVDPAAVADAWREPLFDRFRSVVHQLLARSPTDDI
jgi:hypothetical protein